MPSLLPGFEYDIFISYRQKDNKHDGWVTKFVENLRGELEATFKEDISIYFDENPHDRLQDTHNVDKSLEGKLKCLIFIPILSQTYCDPNCYAWQYEFLAFNTIAREDVFGRDIRLRSGNYASRILPIRIHDLDQEDGKLFEKETGSVLRAMDFIFKTAAGVNRPLQSNEDRPNDNMNKTIYRDQMNKVANAIKEIMQGLKSKQDGPDKVIQHGNLLNEGNNPEKSDEQKKTLKLNKTKFILILFLTTVLLLAAIVIYPRIFKNDKLAAVRSSDGRISVAVMPFQNLTNDTTWNIWADGIQNEVIAYLTNFTKELKVQQKETVNSVLQSNMHSDYSSLTPATAARISQKLDASVYVFGTIKQAGRIIRLNAQLIDSKSEEVIKSIQVEGISEEGKILQYIDSLNLLIKNSLIISKLEKEITPDLQPVGFSNDPEAYRYYLIGYKSYWRDDFPTAIKWLRLAIEADSNITLPSAMYLSNAYGLLGQYSEARKWCMILYEKKDGLSLQNRLYAEWLYGEYFLRDQHQQVINFRQQIDFDDQMPLFHWMLGLTYSSIYQFDNAIPEFEKALEIYKKWGSKPIKSLCYTSLGYSYHMTGQINKEEQIYKQAELDFPGDNNLISQQAALSLSKGDSSKAKEYIKLYISVCKNNEWTEVSIDSGLAGIYLSAAMPSKAEYYFRKALLQEPQNPQLLNCLAFLLIDKDRNINEGIKLADMALGLSPDNYSCLDTKGWGMYKQGRFREALELVQKSWDLRPRYDHQVYLHLEEIKKTIVSQN